MPGGIETELQLRFFANALDVIDTMPDLVNRVVEVFSDGFVHVEDWP